MIIVTGVKGQLGHDVVKTLTNIGYSNILGIDIDDLDITDSRAVDAFFMIHKPSIIIHCAAYTAVDKAEDFPELCTQVNVIGTRNLVEQAIKYNSKFLYISTDYIFDGEKEGIYDVNDLPNPKSIYGQTKYFGEVETRKHWKHFIVRISWVFGKNGNNFVKTMLRLGREKAFLNVVNDQIGSPTYTLDLSKLIIELIETDKYGIYHATNEGFCSWYDFTKEIFRLSEIDIPVYPISTHEYPTKAKRPMNSRLSKNILDEKGFNRLPIWQDALHRYLKEIGEL